MNAGENPKLFADSEDMNVILSILVTLRPSTYKSGMFNLGTGCAESFEKIAEAVAKYHCNGEVETIPFPEHQKSTYQEFTQVDLTRLLEKQKSLPKSIRLRLN